MSEVVELEDESQVNDILKKLEKGDRVKVNVNGQEVEYFNPPEPVPVCAEHSFEFAGMENEHHVAVKCSNCINGRVIDVRTHKLLDGKIVVI